MADNILRLKVESSEYDAKLKKAAEGIRHLADVAHKSGGELTGLEKAELDYIKALGEMETKSRSAAGKTRELESAFKELTVVYNELNDVEKADEGGKALAKSLETLKKRAQEAKGQLDNASKSLQSNSDAGKEDSSALDALASKFTINIDAIKLFNMGLTATKAVLDVAKDAFFASESNVDEWGRIVASSESVYQSFLTALNTGDISGFLGRIDEIVSAARTAYDELDRLGTMKTIQGPQMSAQQTENERMRMMIQTGRYIAPVDGRRATMQSGQLLTADQIRRIEQQLQNGMKTVTTLVGNEVKQTGNAIDAVYNRQAQELGMSLTEFRKGTSSMAEFDKRIAGYANYQKWRRENTYTDNWGNQRVKEGNPYQQYKNWGTFRVDGERYNDLVRLIQQRDQQAAQAYGMQSQAYRTMNRAEGTTLRQIMNGGAGGGRTGGGGRTTISIEDMLADTLAKALNRVDATAIKDAQAKMDSQPSAAWQMVYDQYRKDNPIMDEETRKAVLKETKDREREAGKETLKQQKKEKGEKKDAVEVADQMVGGINNMVSSLEGLGIEIPQGFKDMLGGLQSIVGVLQSIMMIVQAIQAIEKVGTFLGLFKNGGIVPHAATGMIIPGNDYSDRTPVLAQSGELILNRAQQGNLAAQLQGNGIQGMQLTATVRGEDIRLALNNNGRRTGRGEYVQSTKRR